MSFGETTERIARLQKGDSLSVIGSLKPSSWADKTTGETKHGLSITTSNSLSVYDIQKRRKPKPADNPAGNSGSTENPYDDELTF
jgi:single-strand DNA-binding protein